MKFLEEHSGYINNTSIVARSYLVESTATTMKFMVSGTSSIIAGGIFKDASLAYIGVAFDNGVTTNIEIPSTYMRSGSALTSNYDVALPYRISDNYATVTWKNHLGETIFSELVAVGVTPKMTSPIVVNYLNGIGSSYTYDLVTVQDTSELILSPILKTNSPILQSMSITLRGSTSLASAARTMGPRRYAAKRSSLSAPAGGSIRST